LRPPPHAALDPCPLSLHDALPISIPASTGSSASTLTVTALDAFGNPVPDATVALDASGTGNTLTQPAATTDATGQVTGALSSTRSEEHTSELQSPCKLVCRLLLEK